MIENENILVAGGAGSIGSELVRQLARKNKVFVLDIDETRMFDLVEELKLAGHSVDGMVGSVLDDEVYEHIERRFGSPTIVFNCAARKHVKPMEDTPMEAVETNIIGTYKLIKFAKNGRIVNISTDKAATANSVMGATKRVAEIIVKNAGGVSVRFGNVLGSRGSVIPFWQGQMDRNEPLTVTDRRMTRYFMTIPDACALVVKAAEIGEPGQTLILDMGEKKNVYELALEILKKSGKEELGIKEIGIRPGETLTESLMTPEEEARAVKKDNFFII